MLDLWSLRAARARRALVAAYMEKNMEEVSRAQDELRALLAEHRVDRVDRRRARKEWTDDERRKHGEISQAGRIFAKSNKRQMAAMRRQKIAERAEKTAERAEKTVERVEKTVERAGAI